MPETTTQTPQTTQTSPAPPAGAAPPTRPAYAGAVPRPRRWRRTAVVGGAVVVTVSLLALAVGSGGSEDSADSDSAGDTSAAFTTEQAPADAPLADGAELALTDGLRSANAAGTTTATVVALDDRSVIRSGSLSLTSDDVAVARASVLADVDALGGYVADEQTEADDDGGLERTDLTLKVPTEEFDAVMERVGGAGTVTDRSQSARDVTEQVVDVDTRTASARASLRRIRLLLGQAESLGDVIRLEQVLSTRQADLESLEAQQESLAAQTDLATVRLTIRETVERTAPPTEEDEDRGFLAGLSDGWNALGSGYVTLATAVGAVLPTAAVLAVLALLVKLVVTRLRRRHEGPAPAAPTAAA